MALRMLANREHSRSELRRKLASKAQEGDDVEAVLDRMQISGFQSDARFAEGFIRSKGERFGAARLRRELAERGVEAALVEDALDGALLSDELSRARAVWKRKFGEVPQDRNEWARQARFMQARGFAVDVIRKLLKEPFDESAQGQ
jgi:regulatory protein